jgi:alpha-N-arabinofuranosidase
VQAVEAGAVHNEEKDEVAVFIINRAAEDDIEISLDVRGFEGYKLLRHIEMYTDDHEKGNSFENPDVIKPSENPDTRMEGGRIKAVVKRLSWNVICLKK